MKDIAQPKYWETEYTDLLDGITFRFKKMSAVDHINLVTKNVEFDSMPSDKANEFIKNCLASTMWSRDKQNWNELIDVNGRVRIPELEENMSVTLDLFFYFKKDVLLPVFTGSKTYQKFISEQEKSQEPTTLEQ